MLMDLIHQKTIVWTVAIDFFLILTFESLFSIWKFLIFIFSEKINFREITKVLEKNAGLLYKKSKKRKVVQAYFSI